jgi:Rrf2 family transcriptional regulator, iron-sulfur cluster assembly transcription factor
VRLELTRKTDLAIKAIRTLHRTGTRIPGRRLAEEIGTTAKFVSQVVAPLVQIGWLDSQPGPTGGYGLVADPHDITVLDLVEEIEGSIDNGRCVLAGGPCGQEQCSVHDAWIEARSALRLAFSSMPVVAD